MYLYTLRAWLRNGSENFITLSIGEFETKFDSIGGRRKYVKFVRFNGTINGCVVSQFYSFTFTFVLHLLLFVPLAFFFFGVFLFLFSHELWYFQQIFALCSICSSFFVISKSSFFMLRNDKYVNDHCIYHIDENNGGFLFVDSFTWIFETKRHGNLWLLAIVISSLKIDSIESCYNVTLLLWSCRSHMMIACVKYFVFNRLSSCFAACVLLLFFFLLLLLLLRRTMMMIMSLLIVFVAVVVAQPV